MFDIFVPQSLCVQTVPELGESLLSYLSRAAVANGAHLTASDIASAAGLTGELNVFKLQGVISALSRLTLVSEEKLRAMTYAAAEAPSAAGRVAWKAWGQSIDAALVSPNSPKICLSCLADMAPDRRNFQQIWDIKTYTVCHRHGEYLTGQCCACCAAISRLDRPGLNCRTCGAVYKVPANRPSPCEVELAGCIAASVGENNPAGGRLFARVPELRGLELQALADLFAAVLTATMGKKVTVASMNASLDSITEWMPVLASFFGIRWPLSLEALIQAHVGAGTLQKLLLQLDNRGLDARLIGLVATKFRSTAERFGHATGLSKKILDSIGLTSTHQIRVSLRCGHDVLLRAASNLNVPVIPAYGRMRILRIENRYLPALASGVDSIRRSLPLPKKGKIAFISPKHMRMTKNEVGARLGVAGITATRLAQANVFGDVRRDEAGNRRPPAVCEADVDALLKSLEAKLQPTGCEDLVSIMQLSKMTPYRSRLWLGHFIMLVKKGVLVPRAVVAEEVGLLKLRFSRAEATTALYDVSRRSELQGFVRRHENPCRPVGATGESGGAAGSSGVINHAA